MLGLADLGSTCARPHGRAWQAQHGVQIELRLDEAVPQFAVGASGDKPAGTTVAQGMTVLMVALRAAGAEGLNNSQIRAAMAASSVSSESLEIAKAIRRDAGIIRKVVQRWVLTMP